MPRRRRGLRFTLLTAFVGGVLALFATPALANPCPAEETTPQGVLFALTVSFNATDAANSFTNSSNMAGVLVTVTITVDHRTAGVIDQVSFSVTDNSATQNFLVTRAWTSPNLSSELAFPGGIPFPNTTATTAVYPGDGVVTASGLYSAGDGGVSGVKVCLNQTGVSETAATLRSVTATPSAKSVALHWRTASEADVLGYNVYGLVHGQRVKLNARIIQTKGAGAHAYSFTYRLPHGMRAPTRFWLQTINLDGHRQWSAARLAR